MINETEYAKALFSLASERGNISELTEAMNTVDAVLKSAPDYVALLDTPAVRQEEKEGLIDDAFRGILPDLVSTLKILCARHAVCDYPKICRAVSALADEAAGIERVSAISAVPMSAEQVAKLASVLSQKSGKTVIVTNTVDASILGGVKLRMAGQQYDGSVRARLDRFEKAIRETVVG